MEYGLHNPHANVIIWCPFVPRGYSSWEEENSHQYWNRLWLHHWSKLCTQNGLVSFALMLQSMGLSEAKPHQEVTQPIASIIFHIPNFLSCFPHFSCSQYMYQEPPNNNLLAEAAVTHKGLNELRPSALHRPSSIIYLSQDGTKVFLAFCSQMQYSPFSLNVLQSYRAIDHKNTVTKWILCMLWLINKECQLKIVLKLNIYSEVKLFIYKSSSQAHYGYSSCCYTGRQE